MASPWRCRFKSKYGSTTAAAGPICRSIVRLVANCGLLVLLRRSRLDGIDEILRAAVCRGRTLPRTRPESLLLLRRPPKIHERCLVDAAHCAIRCAILLGPELVL